MIENLTSTEAIAIGSMLGASIVIIALAVTESYNRLIRKRRHEKD
jgi:hypothetical protein